VPPIAYKLRSLSDLPGLILQVAGTPSTEYSYRYRYRPLCIREYSYRIVSVRARIVRYLAKTDASTLVGVAVNVSVQISIWKLQMSD